jgi:hypothetical protein
MKRREGPGRFAQTALGAIAHHRPANPAGGREADTNVILGVGAEPGLT